MKVLIVEDDETHMKLVHVVLAHAGHTVSGATEAAHALTAIKNSKPSVVLLDLSLPKMDGLTLTRLLKKNQATRHIPIIALTAYPDRYSREEALKAGCDAYFVKPIDTRELPKAVAKAALVKKGRQAKTH